MSSPLIINVNRNWHFEIKPLYSFIMLLGIAICLTAAIWQYNKSRYFHAQVIDSVQLQGQFLNEYSHFLDNQTLHGKPGYALITPFRSGDDIYLVNRGFVPFKTRDQLPKIEPIQETVLVEGILKAHNKPLLLNSTLQDPIESRIQYIDKTYFESLVNEKVVEKNLIQQQGPGLLTAQPLKASYLNHHRHQAYAIQWILLGLCGVCILLIASVKRDDTNE